MTNFEKGDTVKIINTKNLGKFKTLKGIHAFLVTFSDVGIRYSNSDNFLFLHIIKERKYVGNDISKYPIIQVFRSGKNSNNFQHSKSLLIEKSIKFLSKRCY